MSTEDVLLFRCWSLKIRSANICCLHCSQIKGSMYQENSNDLPWNNTGIVWSLGIWSAMSILDPYRLSSEIHLHSIPIPTLFVESSSIFNWSWNFNPKLMCGLSNVWGNSGNNTITLPQGKWNPPSRGKLICNISSCNKIGYLNRVWLFQQFQWPPILRDIFPVDKEFSTNFFLLMYLVSSLCRHPLLSFLNCTFILGSF